MAKLQNESESTKDFSEEPPEHESKRSFLIELTVSVLYTLVKIALMAAVGASAGSLSLAQLQASNGYLRAQENVWLWEQEIIVELRVVQTANCPEGWEEFARHAWPGNSEGCSCALRVGLFEYEAVLRGRCSQREFEKGCRSVPAHAALAFHFWRPRAHLCVKRLQNYNFYSSGASILNPKGHSASSCSRGEDFQVDLIAPIPCPLTSLASHSTLPHFLPELNFTFAREDNYPLVHFRISEHAFCEALADNNKSPGRTANYVLETGDQYECGSTDSRTELLDSQGEAELFRSNPRIEQLTATLPAYPPLSNDYAYRLGFVRYPAWTYRCRNSAAFGLGAATAFLTLAEIAPAVARLQALVLVSTLLSAVWVAYYWATCYFYLKTKYMHGYLYLKDYEIRRINPHTNIVKNRTAEIAKFLAFEASPAATILFLVLLYFQLSSAKDWFSAAAACTEGSFVGYLKSYEQFFGGQMVVALASIFVSLGLIFLDLSYLLWRYFKGDLEEEEAEEEVDTEKASAMNDFKLKQISVTEEFLVDNTFAVEKIGDLNIYTFDDEEDEGGISEYSQSSKAD